VVVLRFDQDTCILRDFSGHIFFPVHMQFFQQTALLSRYTGASTGYK
jgi:hypothetical protein